MNHIIHNTHVGLCCLPIYVAFLHFSLKPRQGIRCCSAGRSSVANLIDGVIVSLSGPWTSLVLLGWLLQQRVPATVGNHPHSLFIALRLDAFIHRESMWLTVWCWWVPFILGFMSPLSC